MCKDTPLQCERLNNSTATSTGDKVSGKDDGFMKLKEMKVPDFIILSSASRENCQDQCLKNCSCTAYAFDIGIGCMLWSGNLIDLQQFPKGSRTDLYIRLAYSEICKLGWLHFVSNFVSSDIYLLALVSVLGR